MASHLLINESPLQVLPTLAKKVGLNEAIVLQQIHYWLNSKVNKNYFNEKLWVRNSYKQWQRQFPFWSLKTIRRIITDLETKHILLSFRTSDFQTQKYYTINYEKLNQLAVCETTHSSYRQLDHTSGQNDHPYGQADHTPDQNDHTPMVKLATPYIEAENTYTENTLLPPLTPPSANFSKKEEEEEVLKKMLSFWNDNIQSKLHPSCPQVHPTQVRCQHLRQLLQNLLANDPDQWRVYCLKISRCQYLMGDSPSGFKVTLDWALKPENALKVLEGAIYDKPQEKLSKESQGLKELPWSDYVARLEQHCDQYQYSEDWFKVCKKLAHTLGQPTFESWLKQLVPIDVTGEKILLAVENRFISEFIHANFGSYINSALQAVYPHATTFEIQTKGKSI